MCTTPSRRPSFKDIRETYGSLTHMKILFKVETILVKLLFGALREFWRGNPQRLSIFGLPVGNMPFRGFG